MLLLMLFLLIWLLLLYLLTKSGEALETKVRVVVPIHLKKCRFWARKLSCSSVVVYV